MTAGMAAGLAHALPGAVERLYSRGAYSTIAMQVGVESQEWVTFVEPDPQLLEATLSFAEFLGIFCLLVTLLLGFLALRRSFGSLVRLGLVLGGVFAWSFLVLWGFNYARAPLATSLEFEVRSVGADELERVAIELRDQLEASMVAVDDPWETDSDPDPGRGSFEGSSLKSRIEDVLLAVGVGTERESGTPAGDALIAWERAVENDPRLGSTETLICARLVSPRASGALTSSGISGIFSPFTQEAHVAAGLVDIDRAFVACHELAHLVGWAREDEANFLAWYVGSRSPSVAIRRGVHAIALLHVLRALRDANPVAFSEVTAGLSAEAVALYAERDAFWQTARVESATAAATAINDAYLKSNGQEGVASYGRMVDLLVADARTRW